MKCKTRFHDTDETRLKSQRWADKCLTGALSSCLNVHQNPWTGVARRMVFEGTPLPKPLEAND